MAVQLDLLLEGSTVPSLISGISDVDLITIPHTVIN